METFFYGNADNEKLISILSNLSEANNELDIDMSVSEYLNLKICDEMHSLESSLSSNDFFDIVDSINEELIHHKYSLDYNDVDSLINAGYYKAKYVIHYHESKGPHWDFRFELPPYEAKNNKTYDTKYCYSYAIPKKKFPESGERILAIRQPLHSIKWLNLESTKIEDGYGSGNVSTVERGIVFVKDKKKIIHLFFPLATENHKHHYMLINTDSQNFLLISKTKE